MHGKPDIVRVVSELGLVLLSYPGLLMVELVMLEKGNQEEEGGGGREYLDLARGEPETGSICDIAVRDHITLRGSLHRRVVLVAMNTEPLDNRHFHIGKSEMVCARAVLDCLNCRSDCDVQSRDTRGDFTSTLEH